MKKQKTKSVNSLGSIEFSFVLKKLQTICKWYAVMCPLKLVKYNLLNYT